MTQLFVKLLPTTLKARLLIYLIEECYKSGVIETASFSCKSMMPFLFSTQKLKKTGSYHWSRSGYGVRFTWPEAGSS